MVDLHQLYPIVVYFSLSGDTLLYSVPARAPGFTVLNHSLKWHFIKPFFTDRILTNWKANSLGHCRNARAGVKSLSAVGNCLVKAISQLLAAEVMDSCRTKHPIRCKIESNLDTAGDGRFLFTIYDFARVLQRKLSSLTVLQHTFAITTCNDAL